MTRLSGWLFVLCLTGGLNRLDDLVIAGATADISAQGNLRLHMVRMLVFLKQLRAGHQHPWNAIAALDSATFDERRL